MPSLWTIVRHYKAVRALLHILWRNRIAVAMWRQHGCDNATPRSIILHLDSLMTEADGFLKEIGLDVYPAVGDITRHGHDWREPYISPYE